MGDDAVVVVVLEAVEGLEDEEGDLLEALEALVDAVEGVHGAGAVEDEAEARGPDAFPALREARGSVVVVVGVDGVGVDAAAVDGLGARDAVDDEVVVELADVLARLPDLGGKG